MSGMYFRASWVSKTIQSHVVSEFRGYGMGSQHHLDGSLGTVGSGAYMHS
jgi:hypothetical protein